MLADDSYQVFFDASGTPYLTYRDLLNQKAIVKRFDGTIWVSIGYTVSAEQATDPSIEIDNSGNLILVYCSDYLYAKKFNTTALGVDSFADTSVLLYPNPVKDNLKIDVSNDLNNFTIEIYDMLGRNIYKNLLSERVTTINTESFASGIYNIRLIGGNKLIAKRFIKL